MFVVGGGLIGVLLCMQRLLTRTAVCTSYGVGAAKAAVTRVPQSAEAGVPTTIAPGPAVATPAAVVATEVAGCR